MNQVCPNCGFPGASIRRDGMRQCKQCHGAYQSAVVYPNPPQHTPGAAGGTSNPAGKFIIIAAVILIATAGIFVAVLSGGSRDSQGPTAYSDEPMSYSELPTAAEPELPAEPRPAAEVRFHGADGMNGTKRWWIVEYRNIGNVALAKPHVRVAVRDDDGNELKSAESNSYVQEVPVGESVWMTVDMSDVPEGSVYFEPIKLDAKSIHRGLVFTVPVQDLAEEAREREILKDYPFVTGRIENSTGERFRIVWVLIMGRDTKDNVVSLAGGTARPLYVKPGESAEFRIPTGAYRDGEVARWTAKVFAVTTP